MVIEFTNAMTTVICVYVGNHETPTLSVAAPSPCPNSREEKEVTETVKLPVKVLRGNCIRPIHRYGVRTGGGGGYSPQYCKQQV